MGMEVLAGAQHELGPELEGQSVSSGRPKVQRMKQELKQA